MSYCFSYLLFDMIRQIRNIRMLLKQIICSTDRTTYIIHLLRIRKT